MSKQSVSLIYFVFSAMLSRVGAAPVPLGESTATAANPWTDKVCMSIDAGMPIHLLRLCLGNIKKDRVHIPVETSDGVSTPEEKLDRTSQALCVIYKSRGCSVRMRGWEHATMAPAVQQVPSMPKKICDGVKELFKVSKQNGVLACMHFLWAESMCKEADSGDNDLRIVRYALAMFKMEGQLRALKLCLGLPAAISLTINTDGMVENPCAVSKEAAKEIRGDALAICQEISPHRAGQRPSAAPPTPSKPIQSSPPILAVEL